MTSALERKCIWKFIAEGMGQDKTELENLEDFKQCIKCDGYENRICYFPVSKRKDIIYR